MGTFKTFDLVGTSSYSLNGSGHLIAGGEWNDGVFSGGVELNGFKSGSISFDVSTVDVSSRGDHGWSVATPGGRSCTIDLTWNKLETDPAQIGLTGMIGATVTDFQKHGVAIAYITQDVTGTEVSGFAGVFIPTSYSESQSGGGDANAEAVECSMTLASWKEIVPLSAMPS